MLWLEAPRSNLKFVSAVSVAPGVKMSTNRLRKSRLFPRQVSDVGAFIFVVLMMPATYIYETSVVMPAIYQEDSSSSTFYLHNVVGLFLLVNLVGNFLGLWLTDTSARFIVLPSIIKVRVEGSPQEAVHR